MPSNASMNLHNFGLAIIAVVIAGILLLAFAVF